MNNLLSNPLYLILVAVLLGAIIAWYWHKIVSKKNLISLHDKQQKRLKGRDRYISQLKVELHEAEQCINLQKEALQKSLEQKGVDSREQKETIDQYLVRMRAAENKLISLQRNYIIFKAQKQKEVDQLQDNLEKVLPIREKLQGDLAEELEVDMDATLELEEEMRDENNPFILRNALINEKRKVEQLGIIKKELSETYMRFAEEKQRWIVERNALENRIKSFDIRSHDKLRG